MVVDGVELRYPQQSRDEDGSGVVQELLLFVPIKSERMEEVGSVRHLLVNTEFARQRFMAAAEWLVQNQAQDGSWRIPAKRVFTRDIYLKPGWCSAMGQGRLDAGVVYSAHRHELSHAPHVLGFLSFSQGRASPCWFVRAT